MTTAEVNVHLQIERMDMFVTVNSPEINVPTPLGTHRWLMVT